MQNNLVKMNNEFMDRHMVSKGFHPSMPHFQGCVLHVLGKENLSAAKQNLKEYLAIIEMASCYVHGHNATVHQSADDALCSIAPHNILLLFATRNIKSSITKRVKAEVEKEWTGDGKLYVYSEEKNTVVLDTDFAECMLMGMFAYACNLCSVVS